MSFAKSCKSAQGYMGNNGVGQSGQLLKGFKHAHAPKTASTPTSAPRPRATAGGRHHPRPRILHAETAAAAVSVWMATTGHWPG